MLVDNKNLKVAIVHEWLIDYSGSERVLEEMINVFPDADIFSIVEFLPENQKFYLKGKKVKTTFIQKMPFAKSKFRSYLALMPLAIEQINVMDYDVVISSSHAFSKGVITQSNQVHFCYCHSPIRYAWDLYHQYLQEASFGKIKLIFARVILHYLRMWDLTTSNRIDYFIANSNYISNRIRKIYRRSSKVIYPPVNVEKFHIGEERGDFYFSASRLVPYKKMDIIVKAFAKMPDKKLIISGSGSELDSLKKMATSNVTFLGYSIESVLVEHMQKCKAFLFASDEDFGIITVEAQACGAPIIAYGKGGSLETVKEGISGIFFREQNEVAVEKAVAEFENYPHKWDTSAIRKNAERFSSSRFKEELLSYVEQKIRQNCD